MFTIKKAIEFDAGHRVLTHGSKCRSPHGHRYQVEAVITGELISVGEQSGMVLDFGFLKSCMLRKIHDPLDHGFIIYVKDEILLSMFFPEWVELFPIEKVHATEKMEYANCRDVTAPVPDSLREDNPVQLSLVEKYQEHYPLLNSLRAHQLGQSDCPQEAIGVALQNSDTFQLYITNFIPTAENLAWHFYQVLSEDVVVLSNGLARLQSITVRETPTSFATYS